MRRCLLQFRKDKVGREEFTKKEYRDWCKSKGVKHSEAEERKIKGIRTEKEA